ncbi:MAG: M16 family metallopeptidase [Gammaproteobacteria bacterium]
MMRQDMGLTSALVAVVLLSVTASCTSNVPAPAVASSPKAALMPDTTGRTLLPDFDRVELPSGAVLLLAPKRDVPLVSLSAVVRGGSVTDRPEHGGLASLTAALLEKGSGARDAVAFVDQVAAVGGQLSSGAGLESAQISGEFLSDDTDLMIELLSDMLKAPRFEQAEFDKLRNRAIESLKAARDGDPRRLVSSYGRAFLFAGHPYGNPTAGTEVTLAALTLADVRAYYQAHYGADRLIVSVVGDFDVARVRAALEQSFGDWRQAAEPLVAIEPALRPKGRQVLLVDKPDATQTYFWLANTGVARSYDKRATLDVANTIFGGRFTSMLNTALRVESGLTYGASSRLSRPTQPGSVALVSFTANDTTAEAIDLALATLLTFRTEPLGSPIVESAKTYLRGQNPLSLETSGQVAGQLSNLEFYGLDRTYVDAYGASVAAVDPAALAEVIAEVYPAQDDLLMVLIGKADEIRDTVAKYGTITEMAISEPSFTP